MAVITIKQSFKGNAEAVFNALTPHAVIAELVPMVAVKVSKAGISNENDLHSVRYISIAGVTVLQEQVTGYNFPHSLEYKIIGPLQKFIKHHKGTLTFVKDASCVNHTLMVWHIELTTTPDIFAKLFLKKLKADIAKGLAVKAERMQAQHI